MPSSTAKAYSLLLPQFAFQPRSFGFDARTFAERSRFMTRFLLLFFGGHLAQALLRGRAELARVFFPALFFGRLTAKPSATPRRGDARYDH
jgi:hypothetical protein